MAEFIVGGKVIINADQAVKTVAGIKKELNETKKAIDEATEKYGANSKAVSELEKRINFLKNELGDANKVAQQFNGEEKFKAFNSALNAVVGGFSVVTAAQALFGTQSKELEETLLKVQSAIALSEGISNLKEAEKGFINLKKTVVDSFNSIKAAIGSTGIGLLIIAIGALAMNWDKVTAALGKASETQKAYNDTLDDYKKGASTAIEKVDKVKVAFDLAKSGVISKKEALATYNETLGDSLGKVKTLDDAEKMYAAKAQVYIKVTALKAQANAIFAKAAEESAKALTVSQDDNTSYWEKAKALTKASLGNLGGGILDFSNAQIEGTKVAKNEIENRSKSFQKLGEDLLKQSEDLSNQSKINNEFEIKDNEKKAEKLKELLEANKDILKQKRLLEQENYLQTIKDEDERAKQKIQFDLKNAIDDLKESKASQEVKNKLIIQLKQKASLDLKAIDDEIAKKRLEENNKTDEMIIQNQLNNMKDGLLKNQTELEIAKQKEIDLELDKLNKKAIGLEEYNKRIALINQNYQIEQDKLLKEKEQNDLNKQAEKDLKKSQDDILSFEQRYAAITERESLESQIVFANEEERTAFRKANAQARKDIANEEANAQIAAAQFAADSLASISQLVGQDTAAGKALAIAAATVSTYLSAQKAYESQFKPLAIYDSPIRGAIAAGIAIANGLATVKKIASVQIPGNPSGGGSAGSKPTFATPPLPPQLQTTTLNQGQIQQMGNAAVRSFVLESDVSGNQERIRRLNRAARIS